MAGVFCGFSISWTSTDCVVDGEAVGHAGLGVVVFEGEFVEFVAAVAGRLFEAGAQGGAFRRSDIGWKFWAIFKFWRRMSRVSMPVMAVATGRLMA